MGVTFSHEVLSLGLRDPFRIARSDHGAGTRVTTVIVELRDDRCPDLVGVGEGYPDRFYGETAESMAAVLPWLLAAVGEPDVVLSAVEDQVAAVLANQGADAALQLAGQFVPVPAQ